MIILARMVHTTVTSRAQRTSPSAGSTCGVCAHVHSWYFVLRRRSLSDFAGYPPLCCLAILCARLEVTRSLFASHLEAESPLREIERERESADGLRHDVCVDNPEVCFGSTLQVSKASMPVSERSLGMAWFCTSHM